VPGPGAGRAGARAALGASARPTAPGPGRCSTASMPRRRRAADAAGSDEGAHSDAHPADRALDNGVSALLALASSGQGSGGAANALDGLLGAHDGRGSAAAAAGSHEGEPSDALPGDRALNNGASILLALASNAAESEPLHGCSSVDVGAAPQPHGPSARTAICICRRQDCGTRTINGAFVPGKIFTNEHHRPLCEDGAVCGGIGQHAARCVCFKGFQLPSKDDRRREWVKILRPGISDAEVDAVSKSSYVHINHFDSAHVIVGAQRINLAKTAIPHVEPTVSPTQRKRVRQNPVHEEMPSCFLNFDNYATPRRHAGEGATPTPRTLPAAQRLVQKQYDALGKQAEGLDAAKEALEHAQAHQQALNVLLEQTENSLWRKDRELKIAQKKYDELISKVAMLESKYSGFDAIKEANEELQ